MAHYVFYNMWQSVLHMGYHYNEEDAWKAFFDECRYPQSARDVEVAKQQGIYFTKSKS